MRYQPFIAAALVGAGLYSAPAIAGTCPTNFYQDKSNFWVSDDPPGWRSYKKSPPNSTLSAKNFGGAMYSPKLRRIACVYRGSDKKWVALVSSNEHPFNPDDIKINKWKYIEKRKNFICGTPNHTRSECEFKVDQKKIK